jgi:CubicO group peptidase (beta-lactamase class C family)
MKLLFAGVALAAGLVLAAPAFGAERAPRFSVRTAAAIDKAVTAHVAAGKATGLAVAVMQDGKLVFSRGWGKANLEWNTPVTPDTVFRIASNTKSFTAASVLILAERGRLSIDDKLSKYLPDFPRGDEVTIRQLLNHTSGIASFDEAVADQRELAVAHTPKEMIALIQGLKPLYVFPPGTAYRYSNSGYHLLGYIVEQVSGQSLNRFMTENIFAKLGMTHTAMDAIEDIVPLRAAGYNRVEGQPGVFRNTDYIPYTTPGPAGGLRSTVGDMALWYQGLFAGKIINAASLKQMIAPGKVADGRNSLDAAFALPGRPLQAPPYPYTYGFGIRSSVLQGHREYWHSGAVDGFTSNLRIYPDEGFVIALASNTFRALDGVLEEVEAAVLDLPPPAPAR